MCHMQRLISCHSRVTAKDDVHGSTSVTEDMDVVSDRQKY